MSVNRWHMVCALLGALLFSGCANRIQARRTSTRAAYTQMEANALNSDKPSAATLALLHRYNFTRYSEDNVQDALRQLHYKALGAGDRDMLFALAELSFLAGEKTRRSINVQRADSHDPRDYYLGSAVYAYMFLFGQTDHNPPAGFDRRFRTACDFYNYGLGQALRKPKDTRAAARLEGGQRRLPFGGIHIRLDASQFPWPLEDFLEFVLADQYVVRGLGERNRQAGIGAALIGMRENEIGAKIRPATPATAFLRIDGNLEDLTAGRCKGALEIHSAFGEGVVHIGNEIIPLETDLSAHTAFALNQSMAWKIERLHFLSLREVVPSGVYVSQPYKRGQIPVVFVHGTFSSPIYWAEMMNSLRADPVLRQRYQFWYFIYNSSAPVLLSAGKLRRGLEARLKEVDPEETDSALKQMVLVGHSQGGLLVKLVTTDTGDNLWNSISDRSLNEMNLTPAQKEEARRLFFLKPFEGVRRAVFIATPHRGSYRAGGYVRAIVRRLVAIPANLASRAREVKYLAIQLKLPKGFRSGRITSIDGMSPKNPALIAVSKMPLAPEVKAHSIIPVEGDGDYKIGNDGVVQYQSAHIEGVESELVVRHKHSCQGTPQVIEEVRRILRLHLSQIDQTRTVQTR